MLEEFFSKLSSLLSFSIFLREEKGFVVSRPIVKTVFFSLLLVLQVSWKSLLSPSIFMIIPLFVVDRRYKHLVTILILSLIPAIWLALTGTLINILRGEMFQWSMFYGIAFRALSYSTIIMSLIHYLRPDDLVFSFKERHVFSLYPYLAWRVTPMVLRDAEVALHISKLKKEGSWRGLSVTLASEIERGTRIKSANYMLLQRVRPFRRRTWSRRDGYMVGLILVEVALILLSIL